MVIISAESLSRILVTCWGEASRPFAEFRESTNPEPLNKIASTFKGIAINVAHILKGEAPVASGRGYDEAAAMARDSIKQASSALTEGIQAIAKLDEDTIAARLKAAADYARTPEPSAVPTAIKTLPVPEAIAHTMAVGVIEAIISHMIQKNPAFAAHMQETGYSPSGGGVGL